MKRIYTILVAILLTVSVFAQAPQKMTYQAVVRGASNNLVTNTQVGIEINIYQGSATGTLVYTETQTPTTNVNGLLSIEIGGQTGFDTISWGSGTYFLETNIDPTGGSTYTITGISQLLTVPYALHAKTAESITGGINETDPVYSAWDKSYNDLTNTPNIADTVTAVLDTITQFVRTETDPVFNNWDKSTGISITESQITDLQHFTNADETDPIYSAWDKSYNDLTNTPNITDTVTAVLDTTIQFVRTELDADPTNEIQTISRTGLTVTLSNGGGTYQDSVNVYTAGDGIDITNNVVSLESKHYVGELFGGGIVFWVTPDGQHGLIASLDDLDGGSGVAWSATDDVEIGATARSMTDGASNTAAIVAQDNTAGYAATLCNSYTGGGYTDWYLPSNRELYLLCSQDILIDYILDNDGDATTNGLSQEFVAPTYGRYWSSTENDDNNAWFYLFSYGDSGYSLKLNAYRVRAVRAF